MTVLPPGEAKRAGRVQFTIGAKFALVLVVVLAALGAMAAVTVKSLGTVKGQADALYSDHVIVRDAVAQVASATADVQAVNVAALNSTTTGERVRLFDRLDRVAVPRADQALRRVTTLRSSKSGRADDDRVALRRLNSGWEDYLASRAEQLPATDGRLTEDRRNQLTTATVSRLSHVIRLADALGAEEQAEASGIAEEAASAYAKSKSALVWVLAVASLVVVAIILLLVRAVVPRVRAYSRFAASVAAGDVGSRLTPRGRDELEDLSVSLNEMVADQEGRRHYEQQQAELLDALQVAEDEAEAHLLVQHHLERAVPDSAVAVLNRNNSADRLQAVTPLQPDSPLVESLSGARPRSCLAVRFGRPRDLGGAGRRGLIDCSVCGVVNRPTRCQPLLVGGEVIGSVLVEHGAALSTADSVCIADSVAQAAPVLANLRNLALAEFRANMDALTGLSNKRAAQDTLNAMVAQASRSVTTLACLLLDLDHFKQINDRFGHGVGDQVLAAVGTTLRAALRASDFASRFGGEEFLVLLPETGVDGALTAAEKIRRELSEIGIPGTDERITASVGLALLPDHAGDVDMLLRHADRALYASKAGGRDRVTVAAEASTESGPPHQPGPETAADAAGQS